MKMISDIDLDCVGDEFTFNRDDFECETTKNSIPVKLYFRVNVSGSTKVRRYYPDMPNEYDIRIHFVAVELADAFYDTEDCEYIHLSKKEIEKYENDLKREIERILAY
jgi:hypothetical protein